MLKVTKKMHLPCKNMGIVDSIPNCSITKKPCVLYFDSGAFGKHIWTNHIELCPSYVKAKKPKNSKIMEMNKIKRIRL